uniref:ATP synthase complex subunit 8 n=1 Tax=Aclees cribratus TaxID=2735253 RepID=A0A7L8XIU2_9CUCU|nr:ATP synthase F0 subunit 8 [Aclees cribratus]QOH97065.1 ATP synthase F0 subunit 8 [Aclees cribratus]QZI85937.1 ATP synthase F0 subunit 8 [Aclees taiwanensis]
MPQMAPMSWLTLYLFFSFLFLMSMILNYYMFLYSPKTKLLKESKKIINWKW